MLYGVDTTTWLLETRELGAKDELDGSGCTETDDDE
jgi:hypothetical protein